MIKLHLQPEVIILIRQNTAIELPWIPKKWTTIVAGKGDTRAGSRKFQGVRDLSIFGNRGRLKGVNPADIDWIGIYHGYNWLWNLHDVDFFCRPTVLGISISEAFPPQTVTFEHRFRGGTSVDKRLWEEGQIFDIERIYKRYLSIPIGSMSAVYGNIYHQYTPNVSIYTSNMDPMGMCLVFFLQFSISFFMFLPWVNIKFHWIGWSVFSGKICRGNPWVFTMVSILKRRRFLWFLCKFP